MELEQAIRERRSIRRYNEIPVSDDDMRAIIEAGTWAPSACNFQLWRFIIINDATVFESLCQMGSASFLKDVRQGVLVLYSNQTDNLEYSDYIQSASAAIENMLLKAYSLGIGTCWVNNLPNKGRLRDLLGIPASYDPIALISMGHYDQNIHDRPRKFETSALISYNTFHFDDTVVEKNETVLGIRRIARRIYKAAPTCIQMLLAKIVDKIEKKFDN